ncbi:glycosyltransferase [Paracoccus tibetensis]|uniref:Glycosyltransferase like family 2 n=1 Tax=Paracoccus tibetensis TaxID=336292 RepID=A0A1G5B8G8_9RHOB|nr:glycosyltransferase [Paracoccus tibetensis]SCX86401.1 Glycosyltransferase like family 2 [Paracoccus tibetensis]
MASVTHPPILGRPLPCPAIREVVVAVPVRNEALRLPKLLAALAVAAAASPVPVTVLILANNCTDDSAAIAAAFAYPALRVEIACRQLADPTAGLARRLACDMATRDGALIMTTDADGVPHRDWIVSALAAAEAGAEVVCGRIRADLRRALLTPCARRVAQLETAYSRLLHETRHAIEHLRGRGRTAQPHYTEAGASLAIRADSYLRIGGMPDVRSSEDRALVHRAEQNGLRIDYVPQMMVTVSARLRGRAEGGMAETLRRRLAEPDPLVDQAMLPLPVIRRLWDDAVAGRGDPYPSRAASGDWRRLRASDLEATLPHLRAFVLSDVRPLIQGAVAA